MRLHTEEVEETLRMRGLLREWSDDGYLDKKQHERLERDVPTDLRTTNVFLRLVLLFFTLVGVAAAVALFFTLFLSRPTEQTMGIFFLIFAVGCYVAAEVAVVRFRFYRYGVEEALAISSVAFLCAGLEILIARGSLWDHGASAAMLGAGVIASLWIWIRFGLWYAFPAAMIFAVVLPASWTASAAAQRGVSAALFVAGLVAISTIPQRDRDGALEHGFSVAEAFLWLGLYLVLNLQIAAFRLPTDWVGNLSAGEFSRPFYWTTWVLIWCLPPLVLARGIQRKDRFVLAAGIFMTMVTLVTNKSYLGWPRHTWDPMILGVVLTGVTFFLRRWLAQGPGGVRHGFTAARLSGKEQRVMNVGSSIFGLVTPPAVTPNPQATGDDARFGGGSGGGGASGDY